MENYWNIVGLTKKQFEVFGKSFEFNIEHYSFITNVNSSNINSFSL